MPVKVVAAIPIACVVPAPALMYLTSSPVTKKWFGIEMVLELTLTTSEESPAKYLSNIGSFLWVKLNALLISTSVPS